jgi:TM2 domain-containing membrane protein YozV
MNFVSKILLLIILAGKIISAQDQLAEQLNKAKTLYSQEEYYNTITELKRLIFFDSDRKYSYTVNELIGECYKKGAKFSEALNYFTRAEISARTPEEVYTCRINMIKINILRRTTNRALSLLDALEADKRFSDKQKEIYYWRGWTYIFADEWDKASDQFAKISTDNELKKFCDSTDNQKYSVLESRLLSYFIPGAGQIYTGNYLSGILSLGWNILWGYTTITAFEADRIFDGIMVADFLWLRFYNGNNQNAENFAIEKNLEITDRSLIYLQNVYRGDKP